MGDFIGYCPAKRNHHAGMVGPQNEDIPQRCSSDGSCCNGKFARYQPRLIVRAQGASGPIKFHHKAGMSESTVVRELTNAAGVLCSRYSSLVSS